MTNDQIRMLIDQAVEHSPSPSIGLSGGEAFYFVDDLLEIANYATSRGAKVAINTNCFWATDSLAADTIVRRLKAARVTKIVASTDTFHNKYIAEHCVINAVESCVREHLQIEIQFVATAKSERLHSFLARNANCLSNITVREIPCHPVGRAENVSEKVLILKRGLPTGKCPNSVLSIAADGRIIPCCNSAGHLPSLQIGSISKDSLDDAYDKLLSSPTMSFLWEVGPAGLVEEAKCNGFRPSFLGYTDQCHLCHDLFRSEPVASVLKEKATDWAEQKIYSIYQSKLSRSPTTEH